MILATNPKAKFDYHFLETFNAGMSLSSAMVKAIRARKVNISGKYVVYQKDQLQIIGFGNEKLTENIPLLLTQKEKNKIKEQISQKGVSCILLQIHSDKRWLKAQIAVAKGKKNYDKKQVIKERDLDREQRRGLV
jgi:SsrA-binding protein